jgi:multiple sugar transport system substrate-binding protein
MTKLNRRDFLRLSATMATGAVLTACQPAAPQIVEVEKPVIVEKEVIKEVPVEKIVEKEVVKEVAKPAGDVWVRFMCRVGADCLPTWEGVIKEDFEPNNPGIRVSVEPAPDGWIDKLLASMIAGEAVDIFQAWGNIFYNWTDRDLILDIQPYVDNITQDEIDDYMDFHWKMLVIRGVRVGLPKYLNIMTMTINKDIFDEFGVDYPPEDGDWDYNDFAEMSAALTKDRNGDGETDLWGSWVPMWNWDRFFGPIMRFGGTIVDVDPGGTHCTMGEPKDQEGLQFMYDLMWKQNVIAQPGQVENQWFHAAMTPGFVASAESGTYPGNTDRALGEAFNWDMRHTWKGPTGDRTVLAASDAWSITKQTKNPDQAWELLHFLAGLTFQRKAIVGCAQLIPGRESLLPTLLSDVRAMRPNLENVRLETIPEAIEWGYPRDTMWFKNNNCAAEYIVPGLEAVFTTGEEDPTYFEQVCKDVDACQSD